MHDVFSNWCRRAILYYLQDHDDPVAVTAVTRQLLVWQRGAAMYSQREANLVERMRSRLLQAHIVEMEEFGILEYDPDTDTVWIPDEVTMSVSPPWRSWTHDETSLHEPLDFLEGSNESPTSNDPTIPH